MIWLSRAAIQYAISLCLEKECQHVGIICSSTEQAQYVYNRVITSCEHDDKYFITRYSKIGNSTIYFENGSSITCAKTSESLRGHKWHQLVIDEHVPDDIIHEVLLPSEILAEFERRERLKNEDS